MMSEEKQNKYFFKFLMIILPLALGMLIGTCVEKSRQSEPKPVERETIYVVPEQDPEDPDLELREERLEPVLETLEDSIHEFEDGF